MVSKKERRKKRNSANKVREGNQEDQQACGPGSKDCDDVFSIPRVGHHGDKTVDARGVSDSIDQCDSTRGSHKSIDGAVGMLTADTPADERAPEGSKRAKKRKRNDGSSRRAAQDVVNSYNSQGLGGSSTSRRKLEAQERQGKGSRGAVLTGNDNSIRRAGPSSAQGDVHNEAPTSRLSELQQRMRHKLEGAQFRMINETLYTSESKAAVAKFQAHPELFDVYHRGFREQVEKWPVHPLDVIIKWLRKYPKARVADFGCGEARLAATVSNKVYSFDLVSPNPRVTACDMANVPLKDSSVHVAVFCLSLMGTNLADFLREAYRVLLPGGLVKVAEVRSRFEGDEDGIDRFLEMTERLGFDTKQMDRSNKMFLLAEFKKSSRRPEEDVEYQAKACVYKRR